MIGRSWIWAFLLASVPGWVDAGDWPAFRGPTGDGVSSETAAPTSWGLDEHVKWKAELPGPGNSSPIVSNGRVFVTCATDQGKQRHLFCYDRTNGRKLWTRTVEYDAVEKTHKTNPYCAPTPAADGERVVVWHGSAGLYCYDFDGQPLWKNDLGRCTHMWGYASSPVIHEGKVIQFVGPGEETFLAAVDLITGKTLWRTDEPGGADANDPRLVASFSTPVIVPVNGRHQIVLSAPTRVVGYDPETGAILWWCNGLPSPRGDLVYSSVTVADGIGIALGGYKGPEMGFTLTGRGDVTASHRLWYNADNTPQRIGSGVIVGDHYYICNAGPGTAQCLELETGEEVWKARLPGGNHWGSVVLAGGLLYSTNQDGTTHVFRPTPEKFELVASNELGESSNATPAVSDGEIFIRTDEHLYCIAD